MLRRDYAERDYLIKFLTAEFGKKMFLVRGAKKRGYKMAADILPFTIGEYVGDISDDGLSYIRSARDTTQFLGISTDIFKNAYATYIMSLIDLAFPDGQPVGQWYELVARALELIDQDQNPAIITNVIELQLLPTFGVAQEWRQCAVCGRTDLPFDYSESYGGLLCQAHWSLDPHRLHLDARTIFFLRQLSAVNLNQVGHIDIKPATQKNLRRVLDLIYNNAVGVHPKAKRFIDQMASWEGRLKKK
ncbi:DNA repair protein RecO [Levilactobacillus bambusae]|uniref:DNA repair protein RecO n=2 Tax=Levilactobacillus bambusae TaxID=2024736 RepID=A0A2V1N3Z3_9LACO|nr:DNA repair protein RecO [Levilactobacillus bambusae]